MESGLQLHRHRPLSGSETTTAFGACLYTFSMLLVATVFNACWRMQALIFFVVRPQVVKPTVGSSWSLQSTIHEDMHDKTKVSGLVELGELSKTVDTATHQRLVWWADYRCIAS